MALNQALLKKSERTIRSLPRINLTHYQFMLKITKKIFAINDIHTKGLSIRILDYKDIEHFSVGRKLKGILKTDKGKFNIEILVIRIQNDIIGSEIINISKELKKILEEELKLSVIAKKMIRLPERDGFLRLHSHTGVDFLLWHDEKLIINQFLVFLFGEYLVWKKGFLVETGKFKNVSSKSRIRGVFSIDDILFYSDKKINDGVIKEVLTLISNLNIDKKIINQVKKCIKS